MNKQLEGKPKARAEYIRKLGLLRKGKFIKVSSFAKRYGLEK